MDELEKVNGQSEKMPTMPISLSDASYSDKMATTVEAATNSAAAVIGGSAPVNTTVNSTTSTETTSTTPPPSAPSIMNGESRRRNSHNRHPVDQQQQQQQQQSPQQTEEHRRVPSRSTKDYRFGKAIGEGSFSTVYLAEDIHTRREWAIKVCSKQLLLREKKHEYVMRERNALQMLTDCPGIVKTSATFHDTTNLYFVITYAKNGDMLPYINKVGSFDLEASKFYAAELIRALEVMHCRGIVHRDLKPENILLDEKMHILITDFGSTKLFKNDIVGLCKSNALQADNRDVDDDVDNNRSRGRKNSFVGTAHYVSPEVLQGQGSGRAADLWALGCIIYQMISGLPPFRGGTEYLIFQKVLKRELTFPEGFDETAADLVRQLIQCDPKDRLGAQDCGHTYESLRRHPFFAGVEWSTLFQQTPPPIYPYLPGLESDDLQRNSYRIPDHIQPGLNEAQMTRLALGMDMGISELISYQAPNNVATIPSQPKSILDISDAEMRRRLEDQTQNNKWNQFADGELILRQGFVNKRKGLFSRKRMLLLTTGPRLIYIDPVNMVKKGEIQWTSDLRVEPKNFRIFFVHTPNRTYYLEDSEEHNAQQWCNTIDDVRRKTYGTE